MIETLSYIDVARILLKLLSWFCERPSKYKLKQVESVVSK